MARLVVVGWASLLVVLIGWRLPIGASSLRRIRRGSLLLLLALLVSLLLSIACLLGLVALLLLTICCWLGITILVVTSRLAAGIVTDGDKNKISEMITCRSLVTDIKGQNTSVVQWEQPVGHIQGKQIGQYSLAESRKTGKLPEQQLQVCCHIHSLHKPGLTGNSFGLQTEQQDSPL